MVVEIGLMITKVYENKNLIKRIKTKLPLLFFYGNLVGLFRKKVFYLLPSTLFFALFKCDWDGAMQITQMCF